MFDLTFTFSFLLIVKTHFYHSPKLHHPQPLANERTLSNDPSAESAHPFTRLEHRLEAATYTAIHNNDFYDVVFIHLTLFNC